ncbi:hypothetical protein HN51_013221 [Arachis hypogaea]
MTKFQLLLSIIPDELLQEIFLRNSAKAVGRCMCLNKFWHRRLRQPETCIQHMRRQKVLDQHVLFHVGYSLLLMGSDSLYIVNAASGEEVHVQQPFGVGIHGWFRIVGVSNGSICFKFSREQDDTRLLVWNPTTQRSREISDLHRDHGDSYATPKSILCYSIEDESFSEVSIPVGVIYTVHNLLTQKEKVALLAHTHNEFGYVASIWHLNEDAGGNRILEQYCRYRELVLTEYDIGYGTRNLLVRRAWRDPGMPHPITVRSTLKYFAGMFPV